MAMIFSPAEPAQHALLSTRGSLRAKDQAVLDIRTIDAAACGIENDRRYEASIGAVHLSRKHARQTGLKIPDVFQRACSTSR
jgi:hypothetical protein